MVSTRNFIIAQIIGIFGLCALVISFQKTNKKSLLKLQSVANLSCSLQFLLLGEYSGTVIFLFCFIRNIIFNKYEKDVPLKYLIITILASCISLIFTYSGPISIIPVISIILYSSALWKGNLKLIRMTDVICCLLFVAYTLRISALTAFITNLIEMTSALVGLYRYDFKPRIKKKEKLWKQSILVEQ